MKKFAESFHAQDIIEQIAISRDLSDSLKNEIIEMAGRFLPKKPNGEWKVGREDGVSCPRCPTCGSRIRAGVSHNSPVRDNRCRICGQLIDWSDFQR